MKIILCPVGTSTLTNRSDERSRQLLTKYANARGREDIPPEDAEALDGYILERSEYMDRMDGPDAKKLSAELHSLLILFERDPPQDRDLVYVIPTDTYIGAITGDLILGYLERTGIKGSLLRIAGLQTRSSEDLRLAFSALVREVHTIYEMYKPQGARILFNLTGGFKAIQGFLQTIGAIYADESVYIFEAESSLMRIPRLPLQLKPEDYILSNLVLWRRLDLGLRVNQADLAVIPEIFVYECGSGCMLSEYGELVWKNLCPEIYRQKVWNSPSHLIVYAEGFSASVAGLPQDRTYILNRRIDKLADFLEHSRERSLSSVDIHPIEGKTDISTHLVDAWADQDAKRIYCHYEGDTLILDKLDRKLR